MYRIVFVSLVLAVFAGPTLFAQDSPAPEAVEETPVEGKRLDVEKVDFDRPVNRGMHGKPYKKMLPAGYRDALEAEQRDEVYRIQESYHQAIAKLRARIDALEKERDLDILKVLNVEQKEKVEKFRMTPASLRSGSKKKKAE